MQNEIFADAISEISITSNVVRIDFVSLSPTERDENNNPRSVFRQRIIMPVNTFGNVAELIRKVMKDIAKPGAIGRELQTRTPGSLTEVPCTRAPETSPEPPANRPISEIARSPNFSAA